MIADFVLFLLLLFLFHFESKKNIFSFFFFFFQHSRLGEVVESPASLTTQTTPRQPSCQCNETIILLSVHAQTKTLLIPRTWDAERRPRAVAGEGVQ